MTETVHWIQTVDVLQLQSVSLCSLQWQYIQFIHRYSTVTTAFSHSQLVRNLRFVTAFDVAYRLKRYHSASGKDTQGFLCTCSVKLAASVSDSINRWCSATYFQNREVDRAQGYTHFSQLSPRSLRPFWKRAPRVSLPNHVGFVPKVSQCDIGLVRQDKAHRTRACVG